MKECRMSTALGEPVLADGMSLRRSSSVCNGKSLWRTLNSGRLQSGMFALEVVYL